MLTNMYQVILSIACSPKVHVIAEYTSAEEALNQFKALVEANKGSPVTTKGKYAVRKKPQS
jgi:hypothetical protein